MHPPSSYFEWNNYRAFRYYSYLFKKHENPLVKQGVFCFLLFLTIQGSPHLETVSVTVLAFLESFSNIDTVNIKWTR